MNLSLNKPVTIHTLARLILVLAVLSLFWGPVWANPDKKQNREREALRRVQTQLQQAQDQVSALEQEKAALGKERDQARKEAQAVRGKLRKSERDLAGEKTRVEELTKALDGAQQDLSATKSRLAETESRLADTAKALFQTQQTLARTEADKRALEGIRIRQEKDIAACEGKNLKLYQTGRELMTRFEQKTCGEILAQKEPFTGLKRVEVENLLEEYRDKLDGQKLVKPPGG